ncbi:MAG: glycosyltransferase [Rhabdochlamydiaceae bacterium]
MNKEISILTSFSDFQRAYSLNIIVQYQIKMLLMNGYTPTVIVHESFKPQGIYAHAGVTIKYIPNMPVHNELKKDETFDEDVKKLESKLYEILKDQDVVLTHDIIYQNACFKHNVVSRKVAKRLPNLKWLHWVHSATSPILLNMVRPVFSDEYANLVSTPFPNSKIIYPNSYAVPSVAKNFGVSQEDISIVPHPTDIAAFFGMDKEVERVIFENDIFSADAITTYPIRLDRGKQVEMVIKTMAQLKTFGLSIRVIIIDFHSTGGDKVTYRNDLKQLAIDEGLASNEVIFLSEQNKEWEHEVDPRIVANFQCISNVFILPSVSETYSLIAQEAGLCKQVMVLNYDFPPFRSIYGENAIYRKYSSRYDVLADPVEALTENSETRTQYGSVNLPPEARKEAERQYHRITAGMIAARLQHPEMAMSSKLRRERNLQTVFKKYLEPLFFID